MCCRWGRKEPGAGEGYDLKTRVTGRSRVSGQNPQGWHRAVEAAGFTPSDAGDTHGRRGARPLRIASDFDPQAELVLYPGDCRDLLRQLPDGLARLVVTSPPYNLGKPYERRRSLGQYLEEQRGVIAECARVLDACGSLCWQVGNWVERGAIVPLDVALYPIFSSLGLKLRNRIVWHFEHGLHSARRFSGRYEVILWFTRSDAYVFDLDAVRVPQK
ncbi:MAG: site-specific DNA-methyltransferase, partial [Acetobacteraceae bacterium]|nr:site-specific DNA-methyltransferase [Acetobacteraceae bacterium]